MLARTSRSTHRRGGGCLGLVVLALVTFGAACGDGNGTVTPPTCLATGIACAADGDCCTGDCDDLTGLCARQPGECLAAGATCQDGPGLLLVRPA